VGAEQEGDNRAGDAVREGAAQDHDEYGGRSQCGSRYRKWVEVAGQRLHTLPEDAGDFGELQAEEIFHLSAGDQDGDAVGEADHDRTGNELDCRAHAGDAHNHQQNAGHHGTHEKSIDAVKGNDAGDDHDEGAGWSPIWGFGTAECGDEKAGDDGAVNAGLGCESGGDGKAMAKGKATRPTVMPAIRCGENLLAL